MTSPPLVLLWADAWIDVPRAEAQAAGACRLTTDRADFARADAVVFPVPTVRRRLPAERAFAGQLWVMWSQESAVQYPSLLDPTYRANFDLAATYRLDSDVPLPYATPDVFDSMAAPVPVADREAVPVNAWISASDDRCGRAAYLRELMSHLPVHSYGAIERNATVDVDDGRATKLATMRHYRFTLAFENSLAPDYVTEKLFEPLLAGSVPVYRGAPNVAGFAPHPSCYVDATKFAGPAELAAYLRQIGDDEYERFHHWRAQGPTGEWRRRFAPFATPTFVRLARAIAAVSFGRRRAGAPPPTPAP